MLICDHAAYEFNYFYPFLLGAVISFAISWSSNKHIAKPMYVTIARFLIFVSSTGRRATRLRFSMLQGVSRPMH